MFDTHCHLNFGAFDGKVDQIIADAKTVGVTHIVIPGTDAVSSRKAVDIAQQFDNVYAAVGIHPHHIFKFQETSYKKQTNFKFQIEDEIKEIENLLTHPKVVAVGEVGVDRHYYRQTKYDAYQIDEQFISLQKVVLQKQIQLAIRNSKSLILHNREAKKDFLEVLDSIWDKRLEGKTVFHCCEPDEELLEFAKQHNIFIGIDGDVTYSKEKQTFAKRIPLAHLVLETDSPFLLPEPLRSQKIFPNKPENLSIVITFLANLLQKKEGEIAKATTTNARSLFHL